MPTDCALLRRFLRYITYETTSDPTSESSPSTASQLRFAEALLDELQTIGLSNAHLDEHGIVTATLPASPGCECAPRIGFIAHMDTSPEALGGPVRARRVRYEGRPIVLNADTGIELDPKRFPALDDMLGRDILVTDGTTLLGADNKAGIAVIMTLLERLLSHPETPHADICVAFTPDEEIGRGVEHFSLDRFGASYAYTIDGGELGRLDTNTFNAAIATVTFVGISVHPGAAKNKMRNALKLAVDFVSRLPAQEAPETTEGFEGYFHPIRIEGDVSQATVRLLVRDHDVDLFEQRKQRVRDWVESYGNAARLTMRDQYYNMDRFLQKAPWVADLARRAYRDCGIEPVELPERGGTDGAMLSARGLPCPNLFTGGHNFHGPFEFLDIEAFEQSLNVALRLARLSASIQSQ